MDRERGADDSEEIDSQALIAARHLPSGNRACHEDTRIIASG